jgi:hypothetical protein
MANLSESSTFDAGVYQLELTDPVIGGPSGISNAPLKNLANRTKYLKDHVDALESTRAPIASPTFTGNPAAPTPAQFDNDTSLATTEFVQRALGSFSSVLQTGVTSLALTAANIGQLIYLSLGTLQTITLPNHTLLNSGATVTFTRNGGAANATIAAYGGSTIIDNTSGLSSSISLGAGESVTMSWDGSYWRCAGTYTLRVGNAFLSSKGSFGYQKLPSGLILQWCGGQSFSTSGAVDMSFTLPISFPNAHLICIPVMSSNGSGTPLNYPIWEVPGLRSLSGCTVRSNLGQASFTGCYVFSLGY